MREPPLFTTYDRRLMASGGVSIDPPVRTDAPDTNLELLRLVAEKRSLLDQLVRACQARHRYARSRAKWYRHWKICFGLLLFSTAVHVITWLPGLVRFFFGA